MLGREISGEDRPAVLPDRKSELCASSGLLSALNFSHDLSVAHLKQFEVLDRLPLRGAQRPHVIDIRTEHVTPNVHEFPSVHATSNGCVILHLREPLNAANPFRAVWVAEIFVREHCVVGRECRVEIAPRKRVEGALDDTCRQSATTFFTLFSFRPRIARCIGETRIVMIARG